MSFLPSLPDADMKQTLKREPDIGSPFSQLNQAVMRGDAPCTPGERECLAAYVSALNACHYCRSEHTAVAAAFGMPAGLLEQLLHDVEAAGEQVIDADHIRHLGVKMVEGLGMHHSQRPDPHLRAGFLPDFPQDAIEWESGTAAKICCIFPICCSATLLLSPIETDVEHTRGRHRLLTSSSRFATMPPNPRPLA